MSSIFYIAAGVVVGVVFHVALAPATTRLIAYVKKFFVPTTP
jgi:hypothetical protein